MSKIITIFLLLVQIVTYSQWTKTYSTGEHANNIVFFDSLNGIFFGEEFAGISILGKTDDGGESWTILELPELGDQLSVLSKEILFSYGSWSELYRSNDSGSNWTKVFDIGHLRINDICFINGSQGFLTIGSSIYKTVDAGLNWNKIEVPDSITSGFNIIHFLDENTGWVSTSDWPNQSFLWTYDRGITWSKKAVSPTLPIYKPCYFVTPMLGYVKAGSNDIYKTSDGGISWVKLEIFFQYSGFINEIFFVNENIGYVGCEYGTSTNRTYPDVFKTTDGGESWAKIYHDDRYSEWTPIYSLHFINENTGFVASNAGLFKTTSGGITDIKEQYFINSEMNFKLFQNYPNPFNPSTTIYYTIPTQSFVIIKVYNSLGEVVAELVNEEKPAGNYDVSFNASGLSSGVYFYRINTANFVETKKMLLLR